MLWACYREILGLFPGIDTWWGWWCSRCIYLNSLVKECWHVHCWTLNSWHCHIVDIFFEPYKYRHFLFLHFYMNWCIMFLPLIFRNSSICMLRLRSTWRKQGKHRKFGQKVVSIKGWQFLRILLKYIIEHQELICE